ncbi:hypothetical protein FHW23_000711 [Curtobacterium pusillum]|uniref:DUF892 family protein n=1 Tax=Curtobacterium pusillum TaxID=69373 RepID=A0AAW3T481_9MICO|nr:hypothetical protein [Curtobacterium pusillum]MBA8989479.1 hypothetical protein [Curtobacterium pusillum]
MMLLPVYLGLLHRAEQSLAESFRQVAEGHAAEPDVFHLCHTLAAQCEQHAEALRPVIDRYGEADTEDEPERLHAEALPSTRSGPVGLLRDLQDVYVLASLVDITWTMIRQAGQGLRDEELLAVVAGCSHETELQLSWLRTRMKQAAPQALVVAS